jgi:small subunit ribosomal protein S21
MIIVDTKKEKSIEMALKSLKNKVQKTRLVQELRERKEYVKPSVKKRKTLLSAIYKDKKKWS